MLFLNDFLIELSLGNVLDVLVSKNDAECTSQRLKRTSGARDLIVIVVDRSIAPSIAHSLDRSIDRSLDRSLVHSIARSIARSLYRSLAHYIAR